MRNFTRDIEPDGEKPRGDHAFFVEICPQCHSGNIAEVSVSYLDDGSEPSRRMECLDCGESWSEV